MDGETSKPRRIRGVQRTVLMGRRLWQQAERDIENAHVLLQPRSWYLAAYIAHQVAEKSLKAAYWHVRGEEAPWTHDLGKCAERVAERAGGVPASVDTAIGELEPMLERTGYRSGKVEDPIPADLVDEEGAQAAIRQAQEIMAWVQTLLQQSPGKTPRKRDSYSPSVPVASLAGEDPAQEELLVNYARLMRERYGARLFLFGSRARGTARPESDYDLVAVAKAFGEQPILGRALDRRKLWREAGGWRIALDLHCYTPEEFREELAGLGYLGQAKKRGELIEIKVRRAA